MRGQEAVIGRAFYVMEFVDGRVLWDDLPSMTPAQQAKIYDEMNPRSSQLCTAWIGRRRPRGLQPPINYFRAADARWSKSNTQASITQPIEAMDRRMAVPAHAFRRAPGRQLVRTKTTSARQPDDVRRRAAMIAGRA